MMEFAHILDKRTPTQRAVDEGIDAAVGMLPVDKDNLEEISLRDFVKSAWDVIEPGTRYQHNWHIDAITDHLEAVTTGEINKLLINIPPRHMKSLLTSVLWQPWVWTFWPEARWLFGSYHIRLSERDLVKSRRILQSKWYQDRWGSQFQLAIDQNEKRKFENTKTGHRIATSVDGGGTGEGGNFIVCDDPLKAKDNRSKAKLDNASEWWFGTMSNRKEAKDPYFDKETRFVMIMQRLHENDPSGEILRRGDYVHLCVPQKKDSAIFDMVNQSKCVVDPCPDRDTRAEGDLLWEERFSRVEVAATKKQLGSYNDAAQNQQSPAPAEGNIIKGAWFKYWTPDTLPKRFAWWCLSVDAAFKGTEDASWVVMQVWARAMNSGYYLMDQLREHMDLPETLTGIRLLLTRHPKIRAKLIEIKANGQGVVDSLRRGTKKYPGITGLIGISPTDSKEARCQTTAPIWEAGDVYVPDKTIAPWVPDFKKEITTFPNAANDDQTDAMTQVINYFEAKGTQAMRYRKLTQDMRNVA